VRDGETDIMGCDSHSKGEWMPGKEKLMGRDNDRVSSVAETSKIEPEVERESDERWIRQVSKRVWMTINGVHEHESALERVCSEKESTRVTASTLARKRCDGG
jgi:hypothetical protein